MDSTHNNNSLALYHAVRRARARAIGAAMMRWATAAARLLTRVVVGCRRRLRMREIAEA